MKSPPDPARPPERWEFYKDKDGEWQWRKFQEKKVVAVSGYGFRTRAACVESARGRGYRGPDAS